jgi:hypothetical protein
MLTKLYLTLATLVVVLATALSYAPVVYACPSDTLLGIPAWYKGMQDANCDISPPAKTTTTNGDGLRNFIIKIALNVIQAALVITGYVAAFFVIKGGFLYIMSQGEPSNIESAKKSIANALIGLIIALLSAAIVNAVAGIF